MIRVAAEFTNIAANKYGTIGNSVFMLAFRIMNITKPHTTVSNNATKTSCTASPNPSIKAIIASNLTSPKPSVRIDIKYITSIRKNIPNPLKNAFIHVSVSIVKKTLASPNANISKSALLLIILSLISDTDIHAVNMVTIP
jgi:hypothetical protein